MTLTIAALMIPVSAFAGDKDVPTSVWAVIWIAGGGAAGWFGKVLVESINGNLAARREFIKETSHQISTLAEKHYWALANHAGLLASGLEEYLNFVDYHLLLDWDNPADLNDRLLQIAKDASRQTFHALCRLFWLFDEFQFEGSNTYLLTSDIAGRSCRQLYNRFLMALPLNEDFEAARLNTLPILEFMSRSVPKDVRDPPVIGARLTRGEFERLTSQDGQFNLNPAREAYEEWLAERRDQVRIAAQSMRAYNELLSHELAYLYRDWFRRQPLSEQVSEQVFAREVARRRWPRVLSEDSVFAIRQARLGSELLQPLTRAPMPSQGREGSGDKVASGGPHTDTKDSGKFSSSTAAGGG